MRLSKWFDFPALCIDNMASFVFKMQWIQTDIHCFMVVSRERMSFYKCAKWYTQLNELSKAYIFSSKFRATARWSSISRYIIASWSKKKRKGNVTSYLSWLIIPNLSSIPYRPRKNTNYSSALKVFWRVTERNVMNMWCICKKRSQFPLCTNGSIHFSTRNATREENLSCPQL